MVKKLTTSKKRKIAKTKRRPPSIRSTKKTTKKAVRTKPTKKSTTKKRKIVKRNSSKQADSVLKNFKFGMELELFTLDEKGYITDGADRIIKRIKEIAPHIDIQREVGKHMIEINSRPYEDIPNVMESVMADLETVLYAADKENIIIYPFGTYPGEFAPRFHRTKHYLVQKKIFGKQRFSMVGRCVGLHCHYTLPWGVMDPDSREVKHLVNSKNKQSLVNIYNLFIAMDPALTTFAQSSPFYQGKQLGKDARVITYRGGDVLDYPQGIFANHPELGGLPAYKSTSTDIMHMIKIRFDEWVDLMKKVGRTMTEKVIKQASALKMGWNAVKINSTGTMEQRGMDINHPRVIIAIAIIIKYISRKVQLHYVQVVPSDIGKTHPFKKEGNTIYIPPDSYVQEELQKKAAYNGLEDDEVYAYCKGLLRLAKQCMPKSRHSLLEPLVEMLEKHKTVSDEILKEAEDMGINPEKEMANSDAAELALRLSKNLYKEVVMTRQMLQNLENE